MYDILKNLDRRWVFLAMGLAVAIPILFQLKFPETSSALSQACFDEIEKLQPGDRVLMAFDFDPSGKGELEPMATSFVHQCCEKRLKMYFMTLWPAGPSTIGDAIKHVIRADYPELVYGEDYVNLGYKPGYEGVIKVIVGDLKSLYTTDARGTNINQIPMCRDVPHIRAMKLIINVSAGYPGAKEWVQYAATPYKELKMVAGCTGVQAALLYPYVPAQLPGLLGAIKGAAEYEQIVNDAIVANGGASPDPKYQEARRRMGPQFVAHLLMVVLIILGNFVYFMQKSRSGRPA